MDDRATPILSPTTGSSCSSTPPPKTSSSRISSMSSSEISQVSNNSAGTSKGKSQILSEDLEGEIKLHGYRTQYAPLLRAALTGDWPAAKAFLDDEDKQNYVQAPITREKSTALHIAATAQHTNFIEELLKWRTTDSHPHGQIKTEDLALKTTYEYTTLHSAAQSGNVSIAKQLLKSNDQLHTIQNGKEELPLHVAAYLGHKNMVSYLFSVASVEELSPMQRIQLLHNTICGDMYDIALQILKKDSTLATVYIGDGPYGWTALKVLANKPFPIGSESGPSFWKSRSNSWFKGVYNKDLTQRRDNHYQLVDKLWKAVQIPDKQFSSNSVRYDVTLMFEAAKVGNVEFLIELAHSYPDLLWQLDETQMSIFHIAILFRQESVFNLIYEIGGNKDTLAAYANLKTKNNMLHLVGQLAPSHRLNIVSGAALQMQRELLWFKEVEKIVPWLFQEKKNKKGKTPKEVFTKAHSNLRKDGEKWMKDTSNYCMLVATLIATVIFAAAFIVPGGNDQNTGTSILLRRNWLKVFFISNAIALCSASTSIAIFLSILTSRYTEEEFLTSLPSKLMLGFATLFLSIVGMMVAFSATCFLVYTTERAWASFAVIVSAGIPIISFVGLHRKLFVDIFHSTYDSRFLFRPNENRLFRRKMQGNEKKRRLTNSSDLEIGRPREDN